jgi:hypothetical protein
MAKSHELPDEAVPLLLACYHAVASGKRFIVGELRADLAHALRGIIAAVDRPGFAADNAEQFRGLAGRLNPGAATEELDTTRAPRGGTVGSSAGDGSEG